MNMIFDAATTLRFAEDGGANDPVIIVGGATIIILLACIIFLILRGERQVNPDSKISSGTDEKSAGTETDPRSEPGLKGYVVHGFENGKKVRFEFKLADLQGDGVLIGRGRDARAQLNSEHVGRVHAQLRCVGGQLQITDLQSMNRTFVNEIDIGKGGSRILEIGAEVGFGPVKLRLARLS